MATYTPGPVEGVRPPKDVAPAFEATIHRVEEINLAVDVPAEVSEWFGKRGHIPIYGTIDDITIRANLVPTGDGRHRIYLNNPMREATGTGEGDVVRMTVWSDDDPREVELPDDLHEALAAAGPEVLEAFGSWSPSHRREYVRAVEEAKRPETRAQRIERTVAAARKRGAKASG